MGLFSRSTADVTTEHTVILRFSLENGPTGPGGTATDVASIATFERRLEEAIRASRAGEFDGAELGQGELYCYAYGPNADRLFAAIRPVAESFPMRPAQALLRYGAYNDTAAPQVVVDL